MTKDDIEWLLSLVDERKKFAEACWECSHCDIFDKCQEENEDEYEEWRKRQYRGDWCPVREANQMTLAEAEEAIKIRQEWEREDES